MASNWHKFYLVGAVGGPNSTVDDLYYNWAVIHTTMMMGTKAAMDNFVRYSQNYVNPDVPNEARLIRRHPELHYRLFSEHWTNSWKNTEQSITDPTHRNRLGRHNFADPSTVQMFFGRGGPVYRSPSFNHPAELTIGHWLGLPENMSRSEAIQRLEKHKELVRSKLEEFGKAAKYTVDSCDEDSVEDIKASPLNAFPWQGFFGIELLHFSSKHDGFEFTEKYKDELRASYESLINLDTSHSVYATERVVFDFTDENPSTKMPAPVSLTDKNSCEYKVQNGDWQSYLPSYDLLEGTKWSSFRTDKDRDTTQFVKALDPDAKWT